MDVFSIHRLFGSNENRYICKKIIRYKLWFNRRQKVKTYHSGIDINDIHNSFRLGPLVIAGFRADRVRVLPSPPEIKLPAHGGHACSPNRVSGSWNRLDLEQYESIGTPPDPARNFPTRSEGRESEPRDDPHTPISNACSLVIAEHEWARSGGDSAKLLSCIGQTELQRRNTRIRIGVP